MLPPKLPVPSSKNVPPVKVMVALPVTSPPLTVTLLVPLKVPAVMTKSLVMVVASWKAHPPPEPLKVTLYQSLPPSVIVLPVSVALNTTVEVPEVNVPPVASQLPETLMVLLPAVRVPLISISSVVTLPPGANVWLVGIKSSFPETTVRAPAATE